MAEDKDYCRLWDCTKCLFQASSVPFGLAHLLCHLLAMCHTPVTSETLLEKVIIAGWKSLEAACQKIQNFGIKLPSLPLLYK